MQVHYVPVIVRPVHTKGISNSRTAALVATLLATVCVLALATRDEGRSTRMAKRATLTASLLMVELQEAAGNSTGNTTTGNATAGNISAIMVPAEEEEPFDLQSWLRTKPSGTWSEFINSHPEQGDFDLSGWLDSQPTYDLNAYLNNQPQPSQPP
mmetsp:Transcript_51069/g.82603  ORF Transcript_51069/g.82603 Transcript_51069/m.82603 type:complete len:155 (+) Transcript_51069:27-491(+)